jgi:Na+-transporting NADH:ubiquinone oxidoreductase subunit C
MKDKVLMVVFVLILGSVLTSALVGVDYYTKDRIEANRQFKIKARVLGALGIPYTDDKAEVEANFSKNVQEKVIGEKEKKFYISQDKDIAFQFEGSGLWGRIEGVLALSHDLETIKGLTIIRQEETPGLGGRIVEADFLNRFEGKKLSPELKIMKPGKAKRENEVDGITGATATGEKFEGIINRQAKEYISLYRKGNQ